MGASGPVLSGHVQAGRVQVGSGQGSGRGSVRVGLLAATVACRPGITLGPGRIAAANRSVLEDPVTAPLSPPYPPQGSQPGNQSGSQPGQNVGQNVGQNAGLPPRRTGTGKAPKILIILGSIILALSVVIGVVIAIIGISSTAGGVGDIEVFDSGSGSVTAEEGDVLQYYVETGTEVPSCDITAPSAEAIGEGTSQTSSTTIEGRQWESFDSITANEAGEYTVDCAGTPVAVGPPVSIGGIFGAVGGILLAVGGGFLGFVLLAIGVILLIVRKRRVSA